MKLRETRFLPSEKREGGLLAVMVMAWGQRKGEERRAMRGVVTREKGTLMDETLRDV